MLGKSADGSGGQLAPIYKHTFPALLQLACDTDSVSKQLFSPLVYQIIHWFSRDKHDREEVALLRDAIMDGLHCQKDGARRDFCSSCVKELFLWLIKHSTDNQLALGGQIKILLKRIMSMARHPCTFQRLGAALAMDMIYQSFREYDILVDIYTLDLLDAFMCSLHLSNRDDATMGASTYSLKVLAHLRRIISHKV